MQDPTGATYYYYDARNRLTEKDLPNGAGSFMFGYDAASNLISTADTATVIGSKLTVTYHYNALNLVDSLTDPSGTTNFGYDQNYNRTSTTYPDGVVLSQSYDPSQRLASIVGKNASQAVLSSFAYSYAKGNSDTMLPQSYSETLMSPSGSVASVNGSMTYDPLNRLSKWLVTQQANPSSVVHAYVYQYDGTSNRTQILADPLNSAGAIVDPTNPQTPPVAHSNENDLSYANPGTLAQIVAYGAAGTNPSTTIYSYDAAGNQTGNDGAGNRGKALSLTYLPTNQTQSITNTSQEPVTMTWAGRGQNERTARSWTDQGTTYTEGYTSTPLGLAGRTSNAPNVPASSYYVRDPYGTPIAERNSDGTEYYYLFDGQGNVVGLEDPGTVVGSYDYCPTGNEADLPGGTVLTQAALNNPLRQGGRVYDDSLKDYFGRNGVISEDYSGVGTQTAGIRFGDVTASLVAGAGNVRYLADEIAEEADAGAGGGPEFAAPPIGLSDLGGGAPGEASGALSSPDFVVSPGGDVIDVPNGAAGPTPVRTGRGFQYTGGSGGGDLNYRVTGVRIMDPTGRYPNGYVVYLYERIRPDGGPVHRKDRRPE
jgi:YD repeat-containing protein